MSGSNENPIKCCLRFLCSKIKLPRPSTEVPNTAEQPTAPTMAEDGIKHTTLKVNGINMHVAEKGEGPVVLFIHGFPDLWYTWRNQIHAISAQGYRAVAPDMRGFGDTDAPAGAQSYTYFHTVGDLVALMDAICADKVFVVGHDWGALVAWHLCLFRPDRVRALVNMSVPFPARNPNWKPIDALRAAYGDDYYVCRFQFLAYRNPGPLFLPKGQAFDGTVPLPPWLPEEEFAYYVDKYTHRGITGGLNFYRAVNINWELTGAWRGAQVNVAVKFIVGDLDLTYHAKGAQAYIQGGGMKKDVPLLQEVVVLPGVGHFLQQESPNEVSNHIIDFIGKFKEP